MPKDQRRSESGKPPTYLMQSYDAMSEKGKNDLRQLGIWILLFTIGLPMLAEVVLRYTGRGGLPPLFFLFSGVGLVVGLSLIWPALGIWMVGAVPKAIGKLLPSKLAGLLTRPDRRNKDE